MEESKGKALGFIKSQDLAVLSYVGTGGQPQSAVVGISEEDDFTLYFGTYNTNRKYEAIASDPRVSLVFYTKEETVQYEGEAVELTDEAEIARAKEMHAKKNSHFAKFLDLPQERMFKIVPKWLRYTDYKDDEINGASFEVEF